MMLHHDDNVYSQSLRTALLRLKRCGCKILEKVKFSQTDDPSATSDLAHVPAMQDTDLHTKFRSGTPCRLKVVGSRNSQI